MSSQVVTAGQKAAHLARKAIRDTYSGLGNAKAKLGPPLSEADRTLAEVATLGHDVRGIYDRIGAAKAKLAATLADLQEDTNVPTEHKSSLARAIAGLHACHEALAKHGHGGPVPRKPSTPPPSGERRGNDRFELDVNIGFQSETNFYTGFSGDISDGGIFVATYDVLPQGTAITVSFVLPDGHLVHAQGRVRWIREPLAHDSDLQPGMGVAFEDLSGEDREAIHMFTSIREPLFHDD